MGLVPMQRTVTAESPSMRREWIEISIGFVNYIAAQVSLHAEGVD